MPHDRYFTESTLEISQEVQLVEDEAHHLHVMRKNVGDTVELINGQNMLATAEILRIEKRRYFLSIIDIQSFAASKSLILAQALPKINRLDDIIEKGTELGVTEFQLFPGERSEKKQLYEKDLERFRRISISAMKQCGRYDLPLITVSCPITSIKELSFPTYFGDLSQSAPIFSKVYIEASSVTFFVGPESGFSPKEIEHLKQFDATGVRLHPNILRTETAPLVALSLIQHWRMK